MIEFLRMLFFAKVVLITPDPIDLAGTMELPLAEPLEAVTAGAALQIDVSSLIERRADEGILDLQSRVEHRFEPGVIEAVLFGQGDVQVSLRYGGHFAQTNDELFLIVGSDDGVPIGVEFDRLTVLSHTALRGVRVYWRNYQP